MIKYHFLLLTTIAMSLVIETRGQSVAYQKAISEGIKTISVSKDPRKADLKFETSNAATGEMVSLTFTEINSGNLDLMWDVYQNKLYRIKGMLLFDDLRTGIATFPITSVSSIHSDGINEFFNELVYTDPPPLSNNVAQAQQDGADLVKFYQPYDFVIDSKGIYFIIGNTHTGKYELWEYHGEEYPVKQIWSENADPTKASPTEKNFLKSREKWKKHVLSDIPDQVKLSRIMLTREKEGLLFFTPEGKIYELTNRSGKFKSAFIGKLKNEFSDLLIVADKNRNTASFMNLKDVDNIAGKKMADLPLKQLQDIIKKD